MHPIGVLRYLIVLGVWLLGAFSPVIALVCSLTRLSHTPTYILIVYYSIRFVFPAQPWKTWLKVLNLNEHPYFNKQELIFDEGAKAPVRDSKVLLAFAPVKVCFLLYSFAYFLMV